MVNGNGSLAALARFGLTGESERLVQALIGHTPVGVFVTNTEGECVYVNNRLCELTGLPIEQQMGFGWRTALHPDDADRVATAWEAATRDGTHFSQDQRFVRPDGSVCQVETSASALRDQDGVLIGWAGVCVDVSRYRELIDNARTAIFTADPAGDFISVNPAAEAMSGYSREELLAMNFFDLIAPEDREHAQAALARAFAGRADISVELQLTTKDGRRVVVETWGRLVLEDGIPVRFEGIAAETTERHLLEDQLTHQAFHDPLTGLPNRTLLLDRISQAMTRAERPDAQVAVILLDLDDFKLVNDSLGHHAGDTLLAEVAPRLQQEVRASDTVARLGGDEFALVIESCTDDCDLVALAERILASFNAPFTLADGTQRITATLGMALPSKEKPQRQPFATPTPPCTRPRPPRKAATNSSTTPCVPASSANEKSETPWWRHSTRANSRCTTSRSSRSPRARSWRSKHSFAGSTRSGAGSSPASSSPSPKATP
jgi:diguanylate cyclase (GGDEF)-like protein/PAS domain S-box-containing protein